MLLGKQNLDVQARETDGSERDALWRRLTAVNRYLDGVAEKAERRLPVLVLAPSK